MGETLRALAFVAMAAFLAAAPARAEDCGRNGEGFGAWLASFKEVAVMDGLSRRAVDAALDGVAYDPAVKRHDGGAAMFGHNFASFAAAHVSPGMVARGKAELKRYAAPLADDRAALWRARRRCWWRSGARRRASAATSARFPTYSALATLAWDCRRPQRFRAELIDAITLVDRGIVTQPRALRGAWAGEVGQTQLMPSAYLMYATTP